MDLVYKTTAILMLCAVSACGLLPSKKQSSSQPTAAMEESSVAFALTSLPPLTDLQQRASALNEATWPLYLNLAAANPDSNLLLSPLSLQAVMGLVYPGTAGGTGTEMAAVFNFDQNQGTAAQAMEGLLLDLTSGSKNAGGTVTLSITNRLWSDPNFAANPTYLDTLKRSFDTGISLAPMRQDPHAAVALINSTIAGDTEGDIQNLLPTNSLDSTGNTKPAMVSTNAIYLQAAWSQPFTAGASQPASFTQVDGTTTDVQMMSQSAMFPYAAGSNYQAVELSYSGDDVAMLVILPNEGVSLTELEASLGAGGVDSILKALSPSTVQLSLPKFSFHWGTNSLKAPLQALGMVQAFDPVNANLTPMMTPAELAAGDQLYIQDILQQTYIDVDEAGTTAAAATAVIVEEEDASVSSGGVTPVVTVDHPAIVALVAMHTGAELFLGRLLQPVGAQ